jgi:Ca2+-binding EF-hand superfamily protein
MKAFRAFDLGSNPKSSIMSKELVNKLGVENTKEDLEKFERLMSKNTETDMTYEEFKNEYDVQIRK